MFRISNIRIGAKLAAASGLGIFLVAGILASQIVNNRWVDEASEAANRQKALAMDAFEFKGIARGLFLGVRDIRLATTQAHIKAATDTVKERREQMDAVLDRMIKLTASPQHRERM